MLLTRATLAGQGPAQRAAARLLAADAQATAGHRLVWTLFAGVGGARSFLYRELRPGQFLILSSRPPEDAAGLWALETKPFRPTLVAGERLGFALRAAPAVSARAPGAPGRGRRSDPAARLAQSLGRALAPAEAEGAALAWLSDRATGAGFRLLAERSSAARRPLLSVVRPGAAPIRFPVVEFAGELVVEDPDRLLGACAAGLGRARAYGCGLLLLRPAGAPVE